MTTRRHTPAQVFNKLREAEVAIAAGSTVAEASRSIGVTKQTFYRWRSEYGGLRIDQARRLKQLESENGRLRRAVANHTLDSQILKEAPGSTSSSRTRASSPWSQAGDMHSRRVVRQDEAPIYQTSSLA